MGQPKAYSLRLILTTPFIIFNQCGIRVRVLYGRENQ